MDDINMNYVDIIKARECCFDTGGSCKDCPLKDYKQGGNYTNLEAGRCIIRLQKETTKLIKECVDANALNSKDELIKALTDKTEVDAKLIKALNAAYRAAKIQAYDDFAEKLKQHLVKPNNLFKDCYVTQSKIDEILYILKEQQQK